jgi:phosphoglycerate kinase
VYDRENARAVSLLREQMRKQTVRDIDVKGKRVLVRVDFNVPLEKDTGRILDDLRIRASLPVIRHLRQEGARVILCSHLGRPRGQVVESLRLAPVAERLGDLLGVPVTAARDCVGPEAEQAVARLGPGDVLLLENLRFHPGEEANDPDFARQLASLADVFVNDAFGAAHRAHGSTAGVAQYLPAVAGLLMEKEIDYLDRAVSSPERPFVAIIGGAKVSDKIAVLRNLLGKADALLVGGGMANTFLMARGCEVGDSLVEEDQLENARGILSDADSQGVPLLLPTDVVVADRFAADADSRIVPVRDVPEGWRIMDIGPDSLETFRDALEDCRTVVWNGPMGVAEFSHFAEGSLGLALTLAELDAVTIVGGGETVALVQQAGLEDHISHVSTGGGASLEFLEGKELPGVAALRDRK